MCEKEQRFDETGAIPNAINIPRGLIEMKLSPSNDDPRLKLLILQLWFTVVEEAELLLLARH